MCFHWVLMGRRVLRRVLRRGSKKGLSRRHLEGGSTPFREYDPLGVCPILVFMTKMMSKLLLMRSMLSPTWPLLMQYLMGNDMFVYVHALIPQEGKQPKAKVLGRISLKHQGPRRPDIPDPDPGMSQTKTLHKAPFSWSLAGSGRDVSKFGSERPGIWVLTLGVWKNFMQENFGPIYRSLLSGTAKGGRPWRGSVKIEPGFFQVLKTRKKKPVKPRKKPVGKCGEYAESCGSGDVVTDRGRTTHVPARGKTRQKTRFDFSPTPSSPTPFGRSRYYSMLKQFYNVQMDAAVLGDRLPEGTQKPLLGPGSPLCSAGIERARKCLQG